MYYVIRSTVVVSLLNTYRLFFLSLFPKEYSITTLYLASTLYYISNPEMIYSIWEDMCRSYANATTFHRRDLNIYGFCYPSIG